MPHYHPYSGLVYGSPAQANGCKYIWYHLITLEVFSPLLLKLKNTCFCSWDKRCQLHVNVTPQWPSQLANRGHSFMAKPLLGLFSITINEYFDIDIYDYNSYGSFRPPVKIPISWLEASSQNTPPWLEASS